MKAIRPKVAGFTAVMLVAMLWHSASLRAQNTEVAVLKEPPGLKESVDKGILPPVSERVPSVPHVTDLAARGLAPGRSGGQLDMLMGRDKDARMMTVYGYARLVGYNEDFEIKADILREIEVEQDRAFTLHLRPGHKWSDGAPFTSEDFRFWWEDVANNPNVSPAGVPSQLVVDGILPTVEIVDELTVRYVWPRPNPHFLPALAGASPLYIYQPAHYLKQLHEKYAEPDELAVKVEADGKRGWAALFNSHNKAYKNENLDLPTLQPWTLVSEETGTIKVFERNPYFHRVDDRGVQLPYIDRVVFTIADRKLIPAKTAAGESDLQARYLSFQDVALLKLHEEDQGYNVHLWQNGRGSEIALYPNLNASDPVWREVLRDARVRRAMSLGVDRNEINQVIYYGLGNATGNFVLPASPLFREEYANRFAEFDLDRANALLDEAGLMRDGPNGLRRLPDGRPFEIIAETADASTLQSDLLLLIADTWSELGIKLLTRPSQRELFLNRVFAGDAVLSVWTGLDNGLPTASTIPDELAPVQQFHMQWPKWGQFHETKGKAGEAPDLPAAADLMELYQRWQEAHTVERKRAVWNRMLDLYSDNVFTIGTVSGVPQPVVVKDIIRNVPDDGLYNWDPGAYFGIYRMDLFWREDAKDVAAVRN